MDIPIGICQCGCGRATTPALRSGCYRKGELQRFCIGHKTFKPIVKTYRKAHDSGNRHLHRIRAENALGKPLPTGASVHHADGIKGDYSTLVICQDEAYHQLLHKRMRLVHSGANPNTEKICGKCRRIKLLEDFGIDRSSGDGRYGYCRECSRLVKRRKVA